MGAQAELKCEWCSSQVAIFRRHCRHSMAFFGTGNFGVGGIAAAPMGFAAQPTMTTTAPVSYAAPTYATAAPVSYGAAPVSYGSYGYGAYGGAVGGFPTVGGFAGGAVL